MPQKLLRRPKSLAGNNVQSIISFINLKQNTKDKLIFNLKYLEADTANSEGIQSSPRFLAISSFHCLPLKNLQYDDNYFYLGQEV